MKVSAYTIEWKETIYPFKDCPYTSRKVKHIAAFDTYAAARAKAIEILKSRGSGYRHEETHSVDRNGLMCDHLRVKNHRHWHQVTIKYHIASHNDIKFW
jgi:hypothetical protein